MDQNEKLTPENQEENKPLYIPRPKWQIVLAWVALIVFLIGVALYYFQIAYKY